MVVSSHLILNFFFFFFGGGKNFSILLLFFGNAFSYYRPDSLKLTNNLLDGSIVQNRRQSIFCCAPRQCRVSKRSPAPRAGSSICLRFRPPRFSSYHFTLHGQPHAHRWRPFYQHWRV